jgi:hypothetical protein
MRLSVEGTAQPYSGTIKAKMERDSKATGATRFGRSNEVRARVDLLAWG